MSRWWTWSPPKNDRSSQTELAKVIARVDEPSATKAVLTGISARRADGQATAVAAADTALAPVAPEILRSLFAFCRRRRAFPRDLRERVEIRLPPKAADQFADAVASVGPAPIRDASLVRPIIAQALAVSTGDGDAVGDQRATAPGAAESVSCWTTWSRCWARSPGWPSSSLPGRPFVRVEGEPWRPRVASAPSTVPRLPPSSRGMGTPTAADTRGMRSDVRLGSRRRPAVWRRPCR